jgi:hypothetical protein
VTAADTPLAIRRSVDEMIEALTQDEAVWRAAADRFRHASGMYPSLTIDSTKRGRATSALRVPPPLPSSAHERLLFAQFKAESEDRTQNLTNAFATLVIGSRVRARLSLDESEVSFHIEKAGGTGYCFGSNRSLSFRESLVTLVSTISAWRQLADVLVGQKQRGLQVLSHGVWLQFSVAGADDTIILKRFRAFAESAAQFSGTIWATHSILLGPGKAT